MGLIFRKLNAEEAHTVQEIATDSWYSAYQGIYDDAYIEKWLRDKYKLETIKEEIKRSLNDEGILFVGVFEDSTCLGFIEYYYSQKYSKLLRLYLRPEKFRMGYGKALIQFTERYLKKYGVHGCELEVNKMNLRAISFYKDSGYVVTGNIKDQYIMAKEFKIA